MLSPGTLAAMVLRSSIVLAALLLTFAADAAAQTYSVEKPRRQFLTVSYDWLNTQPLHFAKHPLEDLVGTDVSSAQREMFEYITRDGSTLIDVLEFKRRGHGIGLTLYPFGMSVGMTMGVRGSIEQLPTIRIAFEGPGALDNYVFTDARAYDIGAGLFVADRAHGWGLGSHAFVGGGVGRIQSSLGGGSRYFAEAGGGLNSGPLGVQLSVKFAQNRLADPVDHTFLTVPVSLRGTVSF